MYEVCCKLRFVFFSKSFMKPFPWTESAGEREIIVMNRERFHFTLETRKREDSFSLASCYLAENRDKKIRSGPEI